MSQLDQYGNPIPEDLVLLPSIDELNQLGSDKHKLIKAIQSASWYEIPNYYLAIPEKELPEEWRSFLECANDYLDLSHSTISYVAECLKRFNHVDGFYHA